MSAAKRPSKLGKLRAEHTKRVLPGRKGGRGRHNEKDEPFRVVIAVPQPSDGTIRVQTNKRDVCVVQYPRIGPPATCLRIYLHALEQSIQEHCRNGNVRSWIEGAKVSLTALRDALDSEPRNNEDRDAVIVRRTFELASAMAAATREEGPSRGGRGKKRFSPEDDARIGPDIDQLLARGRSMRYACRTIARRESADGTTSYKTIERSWARWKKKPCR